MPLNHPVLIGALAGIAGGLMVLAAFKAGLLAFILLFAAPAAVYIAAMGWGTLAGIVSAIVAAALAGVFGAPSLAMLTGILLFGPAAWVGHLVNLAQPADNHDGRGTGLVWYPLSAILLRLMSALALGFVAAGIFAGYSPDIFISAFVDLMKQMAEGSAEFTAPPDDVLMEQAAAYARLLPIIVPCIWLLLHVLTAYISAAITRRSGLLAREEEDIAATLNLPIEAAGFMAAGLIGTMFLSGTVAAVGSVFLGIAIAGYALIGLAQLHYRTRPMQSRGFILSLAYGMIILFTVPLFIFTVMGLIRSFSQNRSGPIPPNASGNGPSNPTS